MRIRAKVAVVLAGTLALTAGMGAALYHGAASGRAVAEGDGLLQREAELLRRFGELGPAVRAAGEADDAPARLLELVSAARRDLAAIPDLLSREEHAIGDALPDRRSGLATVPRSLAPWLEAVERVAESPEGVAAVALADAALGFERTVRPALDAAVAQRLADTAALHATAARGIELGQRVSLWFPLAGFVAVALLGASLFVPVDRRLRRLAAAARLVGTGDLRIVLPATGRDELAEVEAAFNSMAGELVRELEERERSIRERAAEDERVLRAYNARLEAGVESRTAQLAAANQELKQRCEELVATRGRLLAADRMATVGQLAAGIGHEINNPLAYVAANLAFLDEELSRPPGELDEADRDELRSALREARDGAARIAAIVRDLKTVSRSAPAERRPVDVGEALRSAMKLAAHELRHRARVEERLSPTPPVLADEGRLTQVFLNLLVNAAQALAGDRAEQNSIRVEVRGEPDGQVIVEIADNGPGIPEELQERIFEPFFTTKPVGQGTGLGLSVCQGIVVGLGGAISVSSELGSGTVFRVSLPGLTEAEAGAASTAA